MVARLRVRLAQLGQISGGDADPRVFHHQHNQGVTLARLHLKPHPYVPDAGELEGVAHQIGNDLAQAHGVDAHRHVGVDLRLQFQSQTLAARLGVEHLEHRGQPRAQQQGLRVELQVAAFDAGDVKDVANQVQ